MAILWHGQTPVAPKWFSKESVEFGFGLVFLLRKPIAFYIMEEAEETNCEQLFLQKPLLHGVKKSCLPLRILHTFNRYKGLNFTAQSTVSNWVLLD